MVRVGGRSHALTTPPSLGISDFTPAWSPNGRTIAFARYDDDTGSSRIFLIRPDGHAQKQLTRIDSYNPSWSPDGRRIVFDDDADLYVISADGSDLKRLTSTPRKESDPAWSPTGQTIAFVRGAAIWTLDLRTHRQRLLVQHATQPSWTTG